MGLPLLCRPRHDQLRERVVRSDRHPAATKCLGPGPHCTSLSAAIGLRWAITNPGCNSCDRLFSMILARAKIVPQNAHKLPRDDG